MDRIDLGSLLREAMLCCNSAQLAAILDTLILCSPIDSLRAAVKVEPIRDVSVGQVGCRIGAIPEHPAVFLSPPTYYLATF